MIYLYVNGVKRKFLLDSGSAITIIKENTLDNLEIHNVGDILLAGITGEGLQAIGMVKLNFGTQPNVVNCVFNVIVCGNNLVVGASGIIGRDFLGLTNSIINYKNNTLQIWNELIPISYEREDIFANIYNYNQGLSTNKEKIGVNYELVEKESVTSKIGKGISYELANQFPLYPSTQERSTNTQDINMEEDYDNEIFYDALQDMPQNQSENVYDLTLFEDRYLNLSTKENQTNGTKIKEFFNKSSQETTSRICHRKNIHGIGEIKETENLNSAHPAKLQYSSGNIPTIKEKTRKAAPDWTAKVEIIQYGELSEEEEEEDFHSAFKQRQQNFIINKANNEREKLHNNIQSSQLQVRNEIRKETNFCVDTSLAKPVKLLQDENDSKMEHTSTEQNSKKHLSNDRITENNVIKLADEIIIPAWLTMENTKLKEKELFMRQVEEILKLSPQAVNVMRTKCMMNFKLIERSSKCLKDPNPLATTLALLNKKYPLSVSKTSARKYRMPKNLFPLEKESKDGKHKHNRTLCKLEAIEWWVDKSEVPSQDVIDTINVLMKEPRKEVKKYYEISWAGSRVQWGPPIIERKIVATRDVSIQILTQLREKTLCEALFPEYIIPSKRVSQDMVDSVKDLSMLETTSRISLSRQLRIILNTMDPCYRYLPCIPGESPHLSTLRKTIHHSNYVIIGHQITGENRTQSLEKLSLEVGKMLIHCSRSQGLSHLQLTQVIDNISIMNKPLRKVVAEIGDIPSVGIKWLRAALELDSTLEFEKGGITFCPVSSHGHTAIVRNKSGLAISIRREAEVINFKKSALRGNFSHRSGNLINMNVNHTTIHELKILISQIAAYIKWNYNSTVSRTIEKMEEEIKKTAQLNEPQDQPTCASTSTLAHHTQRPNTVEASTTSLAPTYPNIDHWTSTMTSS
ncbi:hypothetical protein RN001_003750 [Aquatica leii]|uniref:Peptidase A2 domain-containing protein n=1 Tax=Aquatica leii TaxID=1421715 RepID=A0AAN7Q6M0_9COLE|nr:hypothetical protein RN001_003750 [Aquatica leii]